MKKTTGYGIGIGAGDDAYVGTDRLSLLPDEIISHIFSFLTGEESVRTSALSKRYKTLYASLPCFLSNTDLNFNTNLFSSVDSFLGFVDRVLNLRDHSMKVNSLTVTVDKFLNSHISQYEVSMAEFAGVLSYATSRGVHHINIEYSGSGPSDDNYPECIYSCKLTTLKLSGGINLTKTLCFKQLISLHLEKTNIKISNLFKSCPCMEELSLIHCVHSGGHFRICAPRLRRLTMLVGRNLLSFFGEITLLSLKLNFFSFIGPAPFGFFTGDDGLPLLERVIMDVDEDYGVFFGVLTSMLEQLGHAKSVTLSYATAEALAVNLNELAPQPSPFEDLKYLHFTTVSMWENSRKAFDVPEYVIAYLVKNPQKTEICYGTPEV